jgi:hypothetical protein
MKTNSYLTFLPINYDKPRRTKGWTVTSAFNGSVLGKIEWFGRWRCYAYESLASTYDHRCLIELADFLQKQNLEHKNGKA